MARGPKILFVLVGVATAVVGSTVGAGAPSAAGTSPQRIWHRQHAPVARAHSGRLTDVSCPTAGFCMAVGERADARAFAERKGNGRWHLVAGPADVELAAVSCTGPGFCMAVGRRFIANGNGAPVALRWDGAKWTDTRAVALGDRTGAFTDVSCTAATACTAVGTSPSSYSRYEQYTGSFAEQWDGHAWQVTFESAADAVVVLLSVSCTSAAFCVAVGSTDYPVRPPHTVVESWDGVGWSEVTEAETGGTSAELRAVSCVASTECTALGDKGYGPTHLVVARLHAGSWATFLRPGDGLLEGLNTVVQVSCRTAVRCTAFASDELPRRRGVQVRLYEGAGRNWTHHYLVNRQGTPIRAQLRGIACVRTSCLLVGAHHFSGDNTDHAVTMRVATGVAASIRTPTPISGVYSALKGVSCASARMCVAVGQRGWVKGNSLIEMWHGGRWRMVSLRHDRLGLESVSCPTVRFCVAVGNNDALRSRGPFVRQWNGSTWHSYKLPFRIPSTTGGGSNTVAVSCPSDRFCMAVGWYLHRYASSWIAGRGWRPVAFGARTDPDAYLKSVSCVSRTFCLAVGRKNEHRHWIERWDGHRWRAVPTPDGRWFAVSCTSRTFCMMVGEYGGSAFWDGASVHAVPTPGQFTGAVSCVSSTDCTAVGATGFAAHGLITRWNGTSWVIEPSVRRVVNTRLLGVSCTAAGCTAVGSAGAGADLPFIERGT